MHLVESGRALSFNELPNSPDTPFLQVRDLYARYGLFQGSAHLKISKEMYDVTVPKTPLTLEKELVYVGKSSMNIHTAVILPSRSLTLATCEVQSVLVDRESRRPAPHPDWWREKFGCFTDPERQLKVTVEGEPNQTGTLGQGSKSHGGAGLVSRGETCQVVQDLPIRDGVTSFDLTVNHSDSDAYGHLNWTAFVKYCLDAVMTGVSKDASRLMATRAVKSVKISFVGEGSVGQRLRVKFWKDEVVSEALHFRIVDLDSGQLITYAFVEFYSVDEVEIPISKL